MPSSYSTYALIGAIALGFFAAYRFGQSGLNPGKWSRFNRLVRKLGKALPKEEARLAERVETLRAARKLYEASSALYGGSDAPTTGDVSTAPQTASQPAPRAAPVPPTAPRNAAATPTAPRV